VKPVEALLAQAVGTVAPLVRLEVLHAGRTVFSGGNAPADTAFDLASVTKVVSTTALLLELGVPLDTRLPSLVPGACDCTLADLAYHRSGLTPFRPFFADELNARPVLFDDACSAEVRALVRRQVIARVASTPPEVPPRQRMAYSDLGFILLGAALEAHAGQPLDRLFLERIARPLGLTAQYRRLSAPPAEGSLPAATGATRPREPAPGQEGMWAVAERPTRPGEVDDDNAWVMDGVSGHAGLFGTALDVARFGQAVLEGRVARPPTPFAADPLVAGSTRALGFDTPSLEAASCGGRFGRRGPRGAIGHLGFTGTSLWIDFDRALVVALLTNRVALGRANLAIRELRPRVHDAILDEVEPAYGQ
jgi:CubicO group peptidase (beta-lactamase class C family)